MADAKPMLSRLVRGCIVLYFTANVLVVARSHRLVDAVKGGQLSYMAVATEREQTAYRSMLMVAGAVVADHESMLPRLVRGCIALPFTANVLVVARSHRLELLMPSRAASPATWQWRRNASESRTDRC